MGVIDTATVRIVPDLSGFRGQAESGVTAAMRTIERSTASAVTNIGQQFGHLGASVAQSLTHSMNSAAATSSRSLSEIRSAGDAAALGLDVAFVNAARALSRSAQSAAVGATQSLRQIDQAAGTMGRGIDQAAVNAARSISRSMGSAANAGSQSMSQLLTAAHATALGIDMSFVRAMQNMTRQAEAAAVGATESIRRVDQAASQMGTNARSSVRGIGTDVNSLMQGGLGGLLGRIPVVGFAFGAMATMATSGIMDIVHSIESSLMGALNMAVQGAENFLRMGVETFGAWEQRLVSYQSLLGSMEAGKTLFEQLKEFAAHTPFELADIVTPTQRYLAFADSVGLAKTNATDFLTTIGNVVSLTGGSGFAMDRVAFAMGQMAAKGKLAAQDVNQLGDALPGFNARAVIAAKLGITQAEAMDRMAAGEINAAQGIQWILEGMRNFPGAAGAMERQSKTLNGVLSTFRDNLKQMAVDFVTPAIPKIKEGVAWLSKELPKALGAIQGWLKKNGPKIGDFLKDVTGDARNIIGAGLPGQLEKLKQVTEHWIEVITKHKGDIKQAFTDIAFTVTELINIVLYLGDKTASAVDWMASAWRRIKTELNDLQLKAAEFGMALLKPLDMIAFYTTGKHPFAGIIADLQAAKVAAELYGRELERTAALNKAGELENQARELRKEIERKRKLGIDTGDDEKKLQDLQNQINALHDKTVVIDASTGNAIAAITRVRSAIAGLPGSYTVTIGARTTKGVSGFASGGVPMPHSPFWVGEQGPELAAYRNGILEILSSPKSQAYVTEAGQAGSINVGPIIVNPAPGMNEMTLARAVADEVRQVLSPTRIAALTDEGRRQRGYAFPQRAKV